MKKLNELYNLGINDYRYYNYNARIYIHQTTKMQKRNTYWWRRLNTNFVQNLKK